MISKEYLAGFIDGEGSIALYKHKDSRVEKGFTIHPQFRIANTNQYALNELNKIVKGKIKRRSKITNCKLVYILELQDLKAIRRVLSLVKDSLMVKQRQAELMIEFCESRIANPSKRYSERDYEIADLFSKLNRRGDTKVLGILAEQL